MKNFLIIVLTLTVLPTFAQKKQTVDLKWKIDKNEKLQYMTVMNEIDSSSIDMDFGNLFKSLSDSTDDKLDVGRDLFKKLNEEIKNLDYVTTLTTEKDGVIDIVMTTTPKEQPKGSDADSTDSKESFVSMMMQMNQGVVLRGSVYETGEIHSFWIKNGQKNLISLFFELPTAPVKIGDQWSLDVNLISNDQNFVCDSAYKINKVTLIDIKEVNGEKIAVLKYNVIEYVNGNFNSPLFFGSEGGQKETMMKFTFQGLAEFSIDQGRWIAYDGIMSLESTGFMTANKKTKFTLIKE